MKRYLGRAVESMKYRLFRMSFWKRVDDATYLKIRYRVLTGRTLNLDEPRTFNDKLNWLKIHDRNPVYHQMVDKYEVKQYVADKIGAEYIIPTLGVWDRFEDIDFNALPSQFVLKCTHDSGGLVICKEKMTFDKEKAKTKIDSSIQRDFFYTNREWPYKDVTPRIIAEKYMQEIGCSELRDYKFYCFNGIPQFLYVSEGMANHATAKISFVNMDWTLAAFARSDYLSYERLPPKPEHFEQMVSIAGQLSKGIPFLRVDLYEIGGRIYFGELTFTPCGGMMPFDPPEADMKVGDLLSLPDQHSGV